MEKEEALKLCEEGFLDRNQIWKRALLRTPSESVSVEAWESGERFIKLRNFATVVMKGTGSIHMPVFLYFPVLSCQLCIKESGLPCAFRGAQQRRCPVLRDLLLEEVRYNGGE